MTLILATVLAATISADGCATSLPLTAAIIVVITSRSALRFAPTTALPIQTCAVVIPSPALLLAP
ncbi:MAG TPA: hypothetical protein P5102_14865, partial [Candidatus Competibacteraceae bacterium]|nr:hypothetical protein [Candidatus Competibacteraceae bacterium]HRZ07402.1 hypothetical protein [Candidatus Competibacteraceae bacterium]